MRLMRIILVMIVGLLVALGVGLALNPLRRSDTAVRAHLLTITALGSDLNDVRAVLVERGWLNEGYHQTFPPAAAESFLGGEIGGYQGLPWYVFVRAFWEFDSSDRLQDIRVDRVMDSL